MLVLPSNKRAEQTAAYASIFHRRKIHARRRRLPKQHPPRTIEREYSAALIRVVDRISGAFDGLKSELPALLNANAAAHRTDAGEGRKLRELVDEARRKMSTNIIPGIDQLAHAFANRTAGYNKVQLNRQVRAALGVDVFIADRKLQMQIENFVNSNVGLIRKLSDEVAGRIETSVMHAMQTATPWNEYAQQLQDQFGFAESRAKLIARDQIGKFYGQTNATRQQELGVTRFVWRTSEDERVRPEHEELDGQTFDYDDPPSEGLPGEPIQCRCTAEPDFSFINDLIQGE